MSKVGLEEMGETEVTGPEESPRDTSAQEDATANKGKGDSSEDMPRDTAGRENFNDNDANNHDLRDITAQYDVAADDDLEEMGETKGTAPEETLRAATAKEEAATSRAEGDIPDELVKELATEESVARKIHESADRSREGSPKDAAAQVDTTAAGATGHDLRDTADCGDIYADDTAGPDLKELPKEADLDIVSTNVPRKRSLSFKRKIKKVKGT